MHPRARFRFALAALLFIAAFATRTHAASVEVPLFDNAFLLERNGAAAPRVLFIVPHRNEVNAIQAVSALIDAGAGEEGAALVVLSPQNSRVEGAMLRAGVRKGNPPGRYLYFSSRGRWYCVDPNRIYTSRGAEREVLAWVGAEWRKGRELTGIFSVPAEVRRRVEECGAAILDTLHLRIDDPARPEALVAAHNNTPSAPGSLESFSFLWFKEGGPSFCDVKKRNGMPFLHEGEPGHIDDLFLVTEERDYDSIRSDGHFNVALLEAVPAGSNTDDGSLSVLCGIEGIRYVNVEAQYPCGSPAADGESRRRQQGMLTLTWEMLIRR